MDETKQKYKSYPMTVDQSTFDTWQRLKKGGDAAKIRDATGISLPTIGNALRYGHVKQMRVLQGINEFFRARQEEESKLKIVTHTDNL